MTIGWQTTGHVRFLLNKYARRFMTLGICEGVLWQNLKFMHMKNIKNKRLQRKNFKNMGDNVYAHHTNDLYQNDDISDSSDHDTDTNSDSNLNNAPGTNYSDANAEVHQAFKGDDRSVFCWRVIVKTIMICIAISLTALTYTQLSKSEISEFEASVRNAAFMSCRYINNTFSLLCAIRPLFSSICIVIRCFLTLTTSCVFSPNH